MARIQNDETGQIVDLEPDHLVGRSPRSTLRLDDEHVSNEHASIRWSGKAWLLKDLASLNGTGFCDDRVASSEPAILERGARLWFGRAAQSWTVLDTDPPSVTAVCDDGTASVSASDGLLALPSASNPVVTVYRDHTGAWVAEAEGAVQPVTDQTTLIVEGRRYTISIPQVQAETAPIRGFSGLRVADLTLSFHPDRLLEHIEIGVSCDSGDTHGLGARQHNLLLLVLARAHETDHRSGDLPALSCGWLDQDRLCRLAEIEASHLSMHVYRIRLQFSTLALRDPGRIIERKPKAHQLRLGTCLVREIQA